MIAKLEQIFPAKKAVLAALLALCAVSSPQLVVHVQLM